MTDKLSFTGAAASAQGAKPWDTPRENSNLTKDEYFAREDLRSSFESDSPLLIRPELAQCALYGILEHIVDVACEHTEAVPSTVVAHVLARFSATIGRTAYIQIGPQTRYLNFNGLIVGPTARGRKGTSAEYPAQLFHRAEYILGVRPLPELTALSTGEGLIHRVRDARYSDEDPNKVLDRGVDDKRLFCDISEFAGTLAVATRKEATITMVLRDAFDGRVLTTPTKTSYNRATGAHISVVGSIPETELVKCLAANDITNGMANRFAMFYSTRTKSVANPKPIPQERTDWLAQQIADALRITWGCTAIPMDGDAEEYWAATYENLDEASRSQHPIIANLLARQDLYTRIFSTLIALINKEAVITCRHIDAALAFMCYWEDTANFVFSTSEKNDQMKRMKALMDRIVDAITTLGGRRVPHTDVTKKLTNNYAANCAIKKEHVKAALELLQRESPPRIRSEPETTKGRPVTCYTLTFL